MLRKVAIIGGLVLLFGLFYAGAAFALGAPAPGGNSGGTVYGGGPHGDYTRFTTDKCAGCHRAHTSVGAYLLTAASADELCATCHAGTGSIVNVMDGVATSGGNLNGGGFTNMGGTPVVSAHNVADINSWTGAGSAWGGVQGGTTDANSALMFSAGQLECTSCHNPHGSTNFRMLNDGVVSHGSPAPIVPGANMWQSGQVVYAAGAATVNGGANGGDSYTNGLNTAYTSGMNLFCATCHKTYMTQGGTGVYKTPSTSPWTGATGGGYYYPNTNGLVEYRHASSYSRSASTTVYLRYSFKDATTTTGRNAGCLTCHRAHGTTAVATGLANAAGPAAAANPGDSALLFYDNRGVCRECHQTTK